MLQSLLWGHSRQVLILKESSLCCALVPSFSSWSEGFQVLEINAIPLSSAFFLTHWECISFHFHFASFHAPFHIRRIPSPEGLLPQDGSYKALCTSLAVCEDEEDTKHQGRKTLRCRFLQEASRPSQKDCELCRRLPPDSSLERLSHYHTDYLVTIHIYKVYTRA